MAPPKKAPKPLPPMGSDDFAAALKERFGEYPDVNVDSLLMRLNNPGRPGSAPILLKGESPDCCVNTDHQRKLKPRDTACRFCKRPARLWFTYWTNTAIEGKWSMMKALKYVPVHVPELLDSQDVADMVKNTADDYVRRGDTGKEILMKQPLIAYHRIKAEQRALEMHKQRSASSRRATMAEDVGRELGDRAGSMIERGEIRVDEFREEQTTIGEEAGARD